MFLAKTRREFCVAAQFSENLCEAILFEIFQLKYKHTKTSNIKVIFVTHENECEKCTKVKSTKFDYKVCKQIKKNFRSLVYLYKSLDNVECIYIVLNRFFHFQ